MLKSHGYGVCTEPIAAANRVDTEVDTLQCGHCQRIIFVKPGSAQTVYLIPPTAKALQQGATWKEEMGAFCRVCMRPICLACHGKDKGTCDVFEKKLERAEARGRLRRAVTGAA